MSLIKVRRHLAKFVAIATLTAVTVFFQNCSTPKSATPADKSQSPQMGGGGISGKTYVTYGLCADGRIDIAGAVIVSPDHSAAYAQIQDCQTLAVPQPIDVALLHFASDDETLFIFRGKIYDQQTGSSSQKVTLQYCYTNSGPAAAVRVWATLGTADVFWGRVLQGDGADTGVLAVAKPVPATPIHYTSIAGQASQLDLAVTNSSASLNYQISGQAAQSLIGLTCQAQSNPNVDDGSTGAPVGTPQRADLLNAYAVRPAWKVAGVDYPVGISPGVVLKDPTLISGMPGVVVDTTNHLIRVLQDNVLLDGYDFTLHGGYGIYIIGASNTAISNSNLAGVQTDADAVNLVITNCVLDGTGNTNDALIRMIGSGSITLEYNWVKNFSNRIMEDMMAGGVLIKYNLIESASGTFSYVYFPGANNYASVVIDFNTTYQTAASSTGIGFRFDPVSGGSMTAVEIGYNTMIALPAAGGQKSINQMIASYGVNIGTAQVHDNYFDGRGAKMVFSNDPYAGVTDFYSNNIDLNSGAILHP